MLVGDGFERGDETVGKERAGEFFFGQSASGGAHRAAFSRIGRANLFRRGQPAFGGLAAEIADEVVVMREGTVRERPADAINEKLATGRVEVLARAITVLNGVRGNLPFPVSVHDEENTREELRLRHRYLDLRRERMNSNLRLRAQTIQAARRFLEDQGFIEVETPVLTRSTPEGARDYLVPSRVCGGEWFALPQSPQLFKQLLMVAGFDRYFQIARCFRDEDLRGDRQPEFTQLDLEMSFVDESSVRGFVEQMVIEVTKRTRPDRPMQQLQDRKSVV